MLRSRDFDKLTWSTEIFPKSSKRWQTFGREMGGYVMNRSRSSAKIVNLCECGPQRTPCISGWFLIAMAKDLNAIAKIRGIGDNPVVCL